MKPRTYKPTPAPLSAAEQEKATQLRKEIMDAHDHAEASGHAVSWDRVAREAGTWLASQPGRRDYVTHSIPAKDGGR
jgi:hypothetical protein